MKKLAPHPAFSLDNILLACLVAFPSLTFVEKRLGLITALGYALALSLLLPAVINWCTQKADQHARMKINLLMLLVGLVALTIAFNIVYPIANSGRFGPGSDRDEALNQAISALLAGHHPYHEKTYLGNPISPMPGSLLLAAPFYFFFGNGAYQNIFWIGVFAIVALGNKRHPSPSTIWAFALTWMVSPVLAQEFLTGGDLLANSLFMAVAAHWAITASGPNHRELESTISALLLGICLSSRANFIMVMPIVFFTMARQNGCTSAIKAAAIATATFAALTGGFYLHDPAAFSPLHTANKLAQFNNVLPHAVLVVPFLTLIASGALGMFGDTRRAHLHMAIVLAIPVVASVLLQSIQASRVMFTSADFALPSLIFAVLGHSHLHRMESRSFAAGRANTPH